MVAYPEVPPVVDVVVVVEDTALGSTNIQVHGYIGTGTYRHGYTDIQVHWYWYTHLLVHIYWYTNIQ